MMNRQLTTELADQVAEPGHPPPSYLWPVWLRLLANVVVNEAGLKTRIDSDLAPTDWQRKIMEVRIDTLDVALTPATADEIAAIVTQLLLGFPMQGAGENCAKYRAKSFLDALKGFPAWAIYAACQDWNNGRELTGREDFQYAPTAPVLRKYAEKHAQPARRERYDLQRILPQTQWTSGAQRLLLHGRYVCQARTPKCETCVIYADCSWEGKRPRL